MQIVQYLSSIVPNLLNPHSCFGVPVRLLRMLKVKGRRRNMNFLGLCPIWNLSNTSFNISEPSYWKGLTCLAIIVVA